MQLSGWNYVWLRGFRVLSSLGDDLPRFIAGNAHDKGAAGDPCAIIHVATGEFSDRNPQVNTLVAILSL